jgi:hypothetical protein
MGNLGRGLELCVKQRSLKMVETSYRVRIRFKQGSIGLFNLFKITCIFGDVDELVPAF